MHYTRETSTSGRIFGITFVVALHLAVIYALVTGLGHGALAVTPPPLIARIIEEVKPPPPPPPPPSLPPKKVTPPPKAYIPPPEVVVKTPPPQNAIAAITTVKPEAPPDAPSPVSAPAPEAQVRYEPVRLPPVLDAARSCRLPQYPSASRRNQETGSVVVEFLIDTDGQVVESKVGTSSGYPRLDEAARDALSLCRFKPGTLDGQPEQSWARINYVWKLH